MRWPQALALGLIPWVILVVACAPPIPRSVATSSSIVLAEDETLLYVTSPDDDAVVVIDPASGAEFSRVAVPGAPEQLALAGTELLVTLGREGGLALIDLTGGEQLHVPLP